jgi:hypothetical protein
MHNESKGVKEISQIRSCRIGGGQNGIGVGFLPVFQQQTTGKTSNVLRLNMVH